MFIDRLEAADLILRLPAPVGEREVLPPPSAPGRDGDGGNPKPAPPSSRPVAAQPLDSLPERGRRVPGHSTQVGEPSADYPPPALAIRCKHGHLTQPPPPHQ